MLINAQIMQLALTNFPFRAPTSTPTSYPEYTTNFGFKSMPKKIHNCARLFLIFMPWHKTQLGNSADFTHTDPCGTVYASKDEENWRMRMVLSTLTSFFVLTSNTFLIQKWLVRSWFLINKLFGSYLDRLL